MKRYQHNEQEKKLYSGKTNYFEDIQNITFFHKNI